MTIQHVQYSRVILAVVGTLAITVALLIPVTCAMTPFLPQEYADRSQDALDLFMDPDAEPDALNREMETFVDDFRPQLTITILLQWAITLLATVLAARWAAKIAQSREQAAGYGLLVGTGAAGMPGLLCACSGAMVVGPLVIVLFLALIGAGILGGRWAAATTDFAARPAVQPARSTFTPAGAGTLGGRPDTFYNMGVTAALGGRRDEARQHFTHVLQRDPRHIPAWLQLANLAETPEQAWEYIQQARAINPSHPAVVQAVEVIWPQVAERVARQGPPRAQPPYAGGAMDSPEIPRSTLPDTAATPPPPGEITPPPAGDDSPPAGDDLPQP